MTEAFQDGEGYHQRIFFHFLIEGEMAIIMAFTLQFRLCEHVRKL